MRREAPALGVLLLVVLVANLDGLLANVVASERDTGTFYFPLAQWAGAQLQQGALPLWIPNVYGGYPVFADGETGLASPLVLAALLLWPAERAFVLLRVFHLALAAVGTYALARTWHMPRTGAVLAGCTFALGSFFSAQVHHENIVRTAAWLPVALAAAERALRARGTARGRWVAVTAATLGLAGLGVHAQVLAIDLLTVALYGAVRLGVGPIGGAGQSPRARLAAVVATFGLFVGLGIALAAVQLVPLGELARFSPRGEGMAYSQSAAYSLTPFSVVQLLFPFFFRDRQDLEWGLWTHWESYFYVGVVPLVLALAALTRPRQRAPVVLWAIVGSVGLLAALGQYSAVNLHWLITSLPGMSALRAPGRFTLMAVLALAMLAGHGLAWLRDAQATPDRRTHMRHLGAACLVAAAGVAAVLEVVRLAALADPLGARALIESAYLSLPRDSFPRSPSDVYAGLLDATDLSNPRTSSALVTLVLAGSLLGGWAVRAWGVWPKALLALAALDLVVFAWQIHPRVPLSTLADPGAAGQALARLTASQPDGAGRRVLVSPALDDLAPNRLIPRGVEYTNGYTSLESVWHSELVARVMRADDQLLDAWGVRYRVEPARYGAMAEYRGVEFMPPRNVLQVTARGTLGQQRFRIPATLGSQATEMRLVTRLADGIQVPQDTPLALLIFRDADGREVARRELRAGRDVMEWAAADPVLGPRVAHRQVESAGVLFEGSAQRLLSFTRVPLAPGLGITSLQVLPVLPRGDLTIFGAAVLAADGSRYQLFGQAQEKYREVYRDARVAIFENLAVANRAFFVPFARVAPLGRSLEAMTQQPFDPTREVVLSAETAAGLDRPPVAEGSGQAARGRTGTATIEAYSAQALTLRVDAPTSGFVVLSDAYFPGWRAWVDGVEQPILRADLLFRAVELSAGTRRVELRYEPGSVRLGAAISVAALAGVALLLVGRPSWRRRVGGTR